MSKSMIVLTCPNCKYENMWTTNNFINRKKSVDIQTFQCEGCAEIYNIDKFEQEELYMLNFHELMIAVNSQLTVNQVRKMFKLPPLPGNDIKVLDGDVKEMSEMIKVMQQSGTAEVILENMSGKKDMGEEK